MKSSEYGNITASRRRNRIIAIVIYSILSTAAAILPVYIEDNRIIVLTVVVIIGGLAILFYILLIPSRNPIDPPISQEDELVIPRDGSLEYYNEQLMTMVLKIVIPLIIVYTITSVWILFTNISEAVYFFAALAFFIIIALVFSKVTIQIRSGVLIIRLGPFHDELKISNIVSIRSVAVKSMGTYLGYGKRVGVDGSIGYITGSRTGVRILMKNGKTYVISHNNPQEMMSVVQYTKKSE